MKYLNEESQFTRVSDAHAKSMMEQMGYTVPVEAEIEEAPVELPSSQDFSVYRHEAKLYALTEEVCEGSDDRTYVRVEPLDETFILQVDESGNEQLTESVSFDGDDFLLEGLYNDEEGNFFVCLEAIEGDDDEEEEEEAEESEESTEE